MSWLRALRYRFAGALPEHARTVFPAWEPSPSDASPAAARLQWNGFRQRREWPIQWQRLGPDEAAFGHGPDWFASHEIDHVATHADEALILIRLMFNGWPDPPEWGLASRPLDDAAAAWSPWGFFPKLPACWHLPKDLPQC